MPLYEATIRHTMHTSGNGAAVELATQLCALTRKEAEHYIDTLMQTRAADRIANHPSTKWDNT